MINLKKASLLAAVGAMLVPAVASAQQASTTRDVVKDERGNIVTNTHGNCVITKWDSGVNECGGAVRKDILSKLSTEERTVYFDFNKSTLNSKEKMKLDEVSGIILDSKEVESVNIVGYADAIGNPSYNRALSKRRAEAVKSYLATKGLKTRNVRVQGQGETNSVTNCDSSAPRNELIACLAADRRVEIELNVTQ